MALTNHGRHGLFSFLSSLPISVLRNLFLYRHFKNNGHSPYKIVIQPVEKIIYDPNSSTRLKNIKRHETELKWIKFLQSPFPLGFNDNIYHEDNISKMPDFDVFSVLECKKRKSRSHGKRKKAPLSAKFVLKNA